MPSIDPTIEGGGDGGGVKKRQMNKTSSFGAGSGTGGYSTDESGASYSPTSKESKSGRAQRRGGKRSDYEKGGGGDFGKASLIWMVLIIGLGFCLIDTAYIVRVLDRSPSIEDERNIMAADNLLQQLGGAGGLGNGDPFAHYIPQTRSERLLHRQDFSEAGSNHRQDFSQFFSDTLNKATGGLAGGGSSGSKVKATVKHTDTKVTSGGSHVIEGNGGGKTKVQLENEALAEFEANHPNLSNHAKKGGRLSPEERAKRLAQQKKDKEEAEAKRIRNIKMAALEALKAEHGGKIPDDMIDKAFADEEAFKPRPMSYYKEASIEDDKDTILNIFLDAGLKEMDDSTYKVLPKWSDVTHLYGNEPRIVGLEQCTTFRAKGNLWDHFVSTAGMFNSGTNLMAEMLIHNCHMAERMKKLGRQNRGIRWQVPWGKHTPPGDEQYRLEHKSMKDKDVDATMILPAVTVRDPYYWMQSMCKHHYTASWRGSDRCPNLIPTARDQANYPNLKSKDYFPLSVRYADFHRHHKSLTGLWNDWYNEYKGVEFQRLFVRYEDLLFHPKNVTQTVCECAGGTMNSGKFVYQVDSAKKGIGAHGSVRTGYVDAIIKYGSERHRYNGYESFDLKYARENLDEVMMKEFGYKYHPMDLETPKEEKAAAADAAEGGETKEEDGGGEAPEVVHNAGNEKEDSPEEAGNENAEHAEEKEEPNVPEEEGEEEGGDKQEEEKEEEGGDGDKEGDEDADGDNEEEGGDADGDKEEEGGDADGDKEQQEDNNGDEPEPEKSADLGDKGEDQQLENPEDVVDQDEEAAEEAEQQR